MILKMFCTFKSLECKQTKSGQTYYLFTVTQDDKGIKFCVFSDDVIKVELSKLIPDALLEVAYNCSYKNNKLNLYVREVNLWKNN